MIKRAFKIQVRLLCILILSCITYPAVSQDSSHLRVSLLTCTPGEELYSTFGHTAIRVIDSNSVNDLVFNYGTFNFEDPGFYTKFIRGKLIYYLSAEKFQDFKDSYQYENRGITEQVLNLDAAEKIRIVEALYENIKPENRNYQYDFFFDNCTTRPRDMLVKYKNDPPAFAAVMPEGTRFREAIHDYLDRNHKDWSKLGIDLLLGAPTDAIMSATQSQFLPDNLMKALDSSNQNQQWVLTNTNLYPLESKNDNGSIFTPIVMSSLLLLVIMLLSFTNNPATRNFLQGFDGIFFFLIGALGVLLVFMWTGTDHAMCKNNYNLLWAWPTHLVLSFFANQDKSWVKKYFAFTAIAGVLLLLTWYFLPQQLNTAFIPIVLLLIYRSYLRSRTVK